MALPVPKEVTMPEQAAEERKWHEHCLQPALVNQQVERNLDAEHG